MNEIVQLARPAAEAIRKMLADKGLRVDALDIALADDVPWDHTAGLIEQCRAYLDTAGLVHTADQTAANYVDHFATHGIDLRADRPLFQMYVTLGFISGLAARAVDIGTLTGDQQDGIATLLRSCAAVLTVLTPTGEAR